MSQARRAAVLLIGNELLSGRVRDENLSFLAESLWQFGVTVSEAAVVRDEVDTIAAATKRLSDNHTWVFTTGGVGPTHDDLSIDGVAAAFDLDVVIDPELEALIRARFGDATGEAHLRMARVPRGARLEGFGPETWPTVRVGNVFVLPGVPSILRRKFSAIASLFEGAPFKRRAHGFAAPELALVATLDTIAKAHPGVEVGSYPLPDHVLVTLESRDEAALVRAEDELLEGLSDLPRV